jgi:hypothetical protein
MMELVRYEAARRALAEAHRVDEVKDIRDKAIAMKEYAKQAKDDELIQYVTEIRLRAERKAGELLIEMRESGERFNNTDIQYLSKKQKLQLPPKTKLADFCINRSQSSRWQKLATIPELEFD